VCHKCAFICKICAFYWRKHYQVLPDFDLDSPPLELSMEPCILWPSSPSPVHQHTGKNNSPFLFTLEFRISKFSFHPCLSDLDIWPESTVLNSTDHLRLSHILHDSLDCFLPHTCSMNWRQIFFLIKLWRLEPGQGDKRLKDRVGYHPKQDLCPPLTALVFLFVFGCCFHSCCFLQNLACQIPIFNCSFENPISSFQEKWGINETFYADIIPVTSIQIISSLLY
jgi:hypothetical protein